MASGSVRVRSSRQSAAAAAAVAASKSFGIEYYRPPPTRRYADDLSDESASSDDDSSGSERSDGDNKTDTFFGDDANSDDDSDVADLLAYERASEYPYRQPRTDPQRYQCAIPQQDTIQHTRPRDVHTDAVWSPHALSASAVAEFISTAHALCGDTDGVAAISDERLLNALKSAQYDTDEALVHVIQAHDVEADGLSATAVMREYLRVLELTNARRRHVYQAELVAAIRHAESLTRNVSGANDSYDVNQLRAIIQTLSDALETSANNNNNNAANETLFVLARALARTDEFIDRARIILNALASRQQRTALVTIDDLRLLTNEFAVVCAVVGSKEHARIRTLIDRATLVITPLQRIQSAVEHFQSQRPRRRLDEADDVIGAFVRDNTAHDETRALNTLIDTVRDTIDVLMKSALGTAVSPALADNEADPPQTQQSSSLWAEDVEPTNGVRRPLELTEFALIIRHCALLCGGLCVGEVDWLRTLQRRVTAFVILIRGAFGSTVTGTPPVQLDLDDSDIAEGISVSLLGSRRGPLTLSDAIIAYGDVVAAVPFVIVSELKTVRAAIDSGIDWIQQAETLVRSVTAREDDVTSAAHQSAVERCCRLMLELRRLHVAMSSPRALALQRSLNDIIWRSRVMSAYHNAAINGSRAPTLAVLQSLLSSAEVMSIDQTSDLYRKVASTVDESEQLRSQSSAALSAKSRRLSLDEWKHLLNALAASPVRLTNELNKVRRVVLSTEEWIANGARLVGHRANAESARHTVPFASIESHCHRMSSRSIAMLSAAESRDLIVLRSWSRVGKQITNECAQSLRTLRSPHNTTLQHSHDAAVARDRYRSERQFALTKLQIVARLYDDDVVALQLDDTVKEEAAAALLKRCQLDSLHEFTTILHLIALPIIGAVYQRLNEIEEVRQRGLRSIIGPIQTVRALRQLVSDLRRCGLSDVVDPLCTLSRRLELSERWLTDARQFMPNGAGLMVESSAETSGTAPLKAFAIPQKRHATRRKPVSAEEDEIERAMAEQDDVGGGDSSGDDDVNSERVADEMPLEQKQSGAVEDDVQGDNRDATSRPSLMHNAAMEEDGDGDGDRNDNGNGDGDGDGVGDSDADEETEVFVIPLFHPPDHPRADISQLESLLTTYRDHSASSDAAENFRLDLVFLPEVELIEKRLALCYSWQNDADCILSTLSSVPASMIAELLQRADDIGVGMAQQKAIESATWKGKWIEAVTRVLNIVAATDDAISEKTSVETLIDLLRQVKQRYPEYRPDDAAAMATDDAVEPFLVDHAVLLRSLETCLIASMRWTDSVRQLFTERFGAVVCDELFPPIKESLAHLIAFDTSSADTLKPSKSTRNARHRRHRSRAADEVDMSDDNVECTVFCLCARPWLEDDDDVMIGCDVCRQWFHSASCLHLTHHDMIKLANAQFTCPKCASEYAYRTRLPTNKSLSAAFHRRHQCGPTIQEVDSLQVSARSLRCDSPQQTTLNAIAQRAVAWTQQTQLRLLALSDTAESLSAVESELESAMASAEFRIASAKIALTSAAIRSELQRVDVVLHSRNTRIRSAPKSKDVKLIDASARDYHRLFSGADDAAVVVHIAPSLNAQFPIRVTITCAAADAVPIIDAADGRLTKALSEIDVQFINRYAAPSTLLAAAYSAILDHLVSSQSANDADMILLRESYSIPLNLPDRDALIARCKFLFAIERAHVVVSQIIDAVNAATHEAADDDDDDNDNSADQDKVMSTATATTSSTSASVLSASIGTKKRRADPKEISSILSAIAAYDNKFASLQPMSQRQTQLRALVSKVDREFTDWSARVKDILSNREAHSYEVLYHLQARAQVRFAGLNVAAYTQRLKQRIHSFESFLEKEVSALRAVKSSAAIRKLLTQRNGECGLTVSPITQRLERECERAFEWEKSVAAAVDDGAPTEVFARLLTATVGPNRVWADAKVVKTCKTMSELYCLCQRPYADGVPMIGCDTCNDWFHLECVGLTQHDADAIASYRCPKCLPNDQTNALQTNAINTTINAQNKPKRKRQRPLKVATETAATATVTATTTTTVTATAVPSRTHSNSAKRSRTRKVSRSSVDSVPDSDALKLSFVTATPLAASSTASAAYTINAASVNAGPPLAIASALAVQQNTAALQRSAPSQRAFAVALSPPSPPVSLAAYQSPYQVPPSLAVATPAVLSTSAPAVTASLFAVVLYQHLSAVVSPSQQVILYHLLRSYQLRTLDARCEAEMIEAVRLLCPDKINAAIISTVRHEYYDKTRGHDA